MFRKLIALLILPVLVAASFSLQAETLEEQPVIHLPGIISTWRKPGDAELPETTIEELGRCMGTDVNIRARVAELDSSQSKLMAEYDDLKKKAEALKQITASLVEERKNLELAAASYKAGEVGLNARKAEIEKMRSGRRLSSGEVKKINALIVSFNAEAMARNRQRDHLLATESVLQEKVAPHLVAIREFDARVTGFNERNTAFNASAEQFNQDLTTYNAKCTGERALKK